MSGPRSSGSWGTWPKWWASRYAVHFDGAVDSAISDEIAEHLLIIVREAVINIGSPCSCHRGHSAGEC